MAKQSGLGFGKLLAGLTERMKKDKRFELCVYGSLVLAGILIYAVTSFPKNSAVEPVSLEEPDSVYSSERETEERLHSWRGGGRGYDHLRHRCADHTRNEHGYTNWDYAKLRYGNGIRYGEPDGIIAPGDRIADGRKRSDRAYGKATRSTRCNRDCRGCS